MDVTSQRSPGKNANNEIYGIQSPGGLKHAEERHIDSAKCIRKRTSRMGTNPHPKRRRLVGKLSAAMDSIPVELFEEILCHLGPDDLLRLSRTCKALRKYLMSKDSIRIWIAAKENVNMPECPADLNIPQFASFLSDTFCTHCLEARALKQNLSLRVRLCKQCSRDQIESVGTIVNQLVPNFYSLPSSVRESILKLLQVTRARRMNAFGPSMELDHMRNMKCYKPSAEEVLKKYFNPQLSNAENLALATERHEVVKAINDDVGKLTKWINETKFHNQWKRRTLIHNRRSQILARLEELGYDEDDLCERGDDKAWKWGTLLDQPRELNDRIWDRIRPQLEETIRLRREEFGKAAVARKESIIKYWSEQPASKSKPFISVSDILGLQASKDLLGKKNRSSYVSQKDHDEICRQADSLNKERFKKLDDYGECRIGTKLDDYERQKRFPLYAQMYNSLQVESTIEFHDVLNKDYVCLRCDPLLREPMGWNKMVLHFIKEQEDWASRERILSAFSAKGSANYAEANNNDHDENNGKPLITVFTLDDRLSGNNGLIASCGCHEAGLLCVPIRCGICFEIDSSNTNFDCIKMLRAHVHAKHLAPTWSHEPVDIVLAHTLTLDP